MKPFLAEDWVQEKQRFPVIIQPKIDGVRGLNLTGALTGRSLKPHANRHTTNFYSVPQLVGLDGELAAEDERHPDLCRITTSALNTIVGQPFTLWHVFDYITDTTAEEPYESRYKRLEDLVYRLQSSGLGVEHPVAHLRIVPGKLVTCLEELLAVDEANLDAGYEGSILRAPEGPYKFGRCTVREGWLLRIKRFIDGEAVVTSIVEGETNTNDAQLNELGQQFRTSHSSGMVPNGLVGNLQCTALQNIYDPVQKDKLLIAEGQAITISPGRMPHHLRKHYFENQHELVGKVIKYKFFPRGMKDKPRFPTFQSLRAPSDMS